MRRFVTRCRTDETGAEIIEFTFVLPLLLLIVAGIIDFGFLFQRYEVVTNAAREGARVGVLPLAGVDAVKQRVTDYLLASGLTATVSPTVSYGTALLNPPAGPTITLVTVTVSYPHTYLILGPIAGLFGGSFTSTTLTASSTMRREITAGP
jgi:Flp pilus assembly protein TadG